jgi:hypothetical protein
VHRWLNPMPRCNNSANLTGQRPVGHVRQVFITRIRKDVYHPYVNNVTGLRVLRTDGAVRWIKLSRWHLRILQSAVYGYCSCPRARACLVLSAEPHSVTLSRCPEGLTLRDSRQVPPRHSRFSRRTSRCRFRVQIAIVDSCDDCAATCEPALLEVNELRVPGLAQPIVHQLQDTDKISLSCFTTKLTVRMSINILVSP